MSDGHLLSTRMPQAAATHVLAKAVACLKEGRLPYFVWRSWNGPLGMRFQRRMLNTLLRFGARRKPRPLDYVTARTLHERYPARDGYRYDPESKQCRARERCDGLTRLLDLRHVRDIAEIGSGDG